MRWDDMSLCSLFFPMKLHGLGKVKKIKAQNKVKTLVPEMLKDSLLWIFHHPNPVWNSLCLHFVLRIILWNFWYLFLDKFQFILPSTALVFPPPSVLLTVSSLSIFPRKSHLPPITIFTSGTCCLHGQTLTYNALFTTMTKKKQWFHCPCESLAHCMQPAWRLLLEPDTDNWS